MNQDITYCTSTSCIHRYACKRSICNYKDEDKKMYNFFSYMDGKHCEDNDYFDLIRFRISDGSKLDRK